MKEISIGYLSRRTGVATSALRYYETLGLITQIEMRVGSGDTPVRISGEFHLS